MFSCIPGVQLCPAQGLGSESCSGGACPQAADTAAAPGARVKQSVGDSVKQAIRSETPPSTAPLERPPEPPQPTTLSPQQAGQSVTAPAAVNPPLSGAPGTAPLQPPSQTLPNPYQNVPSLYDLYTQTGTAGASLQRFGSEIFRNGTGNVDALPMDLPVGPDYVLGVGDGLNIELWGSVSDRLQRVVDREGQVAIPEVGVIQAAGRTLAETQRALEALLLSRFRNVQAAVSLARVRTVRVYLVGDVERPGAYDISSLSTPLNGLYAAGGPTARGSLRVARHYRGQQLVQEVDIYDLILRGTRPDLQRLQPGDTILVPPARDQVSLEGMVRRPAIYELRGERSLAEALALAGGVLPTGTLRHIEVERVLAHEKRTMLSLDLPESADHSAADRLLQEFQVQDQDRVRISPILPYSEKTVFLTGHVARPGKYSYGDGMTVADLIKSSQDLLPEPAAHAELVRLVPPEFRPIVIPFAVMPREGKVEAIRLEPFDTVRIFSRFDFEDPPSISMRGEVRRPGEHRLSGEIHVRDAVFLAGGLTIDASLEQAHIYRKLPGSHLRVFAINLAAAMAGDGAANLALEPKDIVVIHSNLGKYDPPRVYVHGEVARPGEYPLGNAMTAADLVRMAGGFTRGAFQEEADLSRYTVVGGKAVVGEHRTVQIAQALGGDKAADVLLQDADVLSIRRLVGWDEVGAAAEIRGEVQYPGTYGIQQGERLSSLLRRAGGFSRLAYPRAAALERTQVREMAERSRQQLLQRIETQQLAPNPGKGDAQEQLALAQTMNLQRQQALDRLRNAPVPGRLVIAISPDIGRWAGTAADLELRPGDKLYIPKKPQFVLVTGEVYNPTAISYSQGKSAAWYLAKAGGPTEFANRKAVFILRADGSVMGRESGGGFWREAVLSQRLQPGDSIVVPEKIQGGSETWKHMLDTAQFLSSVAIVAKVASGL